MLHVAFVRSPHAHARIVSIDAAEARALVGVVSVVTGEDMAPVCSGWVGTLAHFQGMKSAMQRPLATGKASWQGEPVAAVVAESRALAEDGVSRVRFEWEPLPVVTDPESALDPATPVIHPELGDNLAFKLDLSSGDVDAAFKDADAILTDTFIMGRHTGDRMRGLEAADMLPTQAGERRRIAGRLRRNLHCGREPGRDRERKAVEEIAAGHFAHFAILAFPRNRPRLASFRIQV